MSSATRALKYNLFDIVNGAFMVLFCFTTLYPFLYLLTLSLCPADISFIQINLIPPKVVWTNYSRVLSSDFILSGYYNTLMRTVSGTILQLVAIICTAYTLSKKYYPHRSFWMAFIVFTMFFHGGLIPMYMLVKNLGFINKIWSLVLPGLIPTFTMIIVRNYFMSIPESLEESARIDGANDIVILYRIIIPVSLPIIATVVLWQAVSHWNAWFDALIYIQNSKKQVLQVILRRVVLEGTQQMIDLNSNMDDSSAVNPESVKAATVMVTSIPIILLYPFVQKYFVKGIMIGSLKG